MEWESIVNQHSNARKHKEDTRKKKYLHKVIVSAVVGFAFVAATICKLVHPILGESGMVIALEIAFYNLGRAKECTKNV